MSKIRSRFLRRVMDLAQENNFTYAGVTGSGHHAFVRDTEKVFVSGSPRNEEVAYRKTKSKFKNVAKDGPPQSGMD